MRIVIIGRFGTESLGSHISNTLRSMCHETLHCDPLEDVRLGWYDFKTPVSIVNKIRDTFVREFFSRDSYAHSMANRIETILGNQPCDLILTTHDFLSPIALQLLKKRFGATLAMWFPDAIVNFHRSYFLSGLYDFLFFKDPFVVERLTAELGIADIHYLPECCCPKSHSLPTDEMTEPTVDLGTAGNFHPARAAVLKHLIREGYRVTLWGPRLPKWMSEYATGIDIRPFVSNHDKVRAFRSCRIVLNTTHPGEIEGTNVRTFEAASSGAFQLATYRPSLENLYELDRELVTYRTVGELVDKVKYYLANPEQRREIGLAGMSRTLADHTYEKRLSQMLAIVKRKPSLSQQGIEG